MESLIVLGCLFGSRAVLRRYWLGNGIVPARPSGLVWLVLLSTVGIFYSLAALQAFGVPIPNSVIESVLGIGLLCVLAAALFALERRLNSSPAPDVSPLPPEVLASPPPTRSDPGWRPALRRLGIMWIPIIGPIRNLRLKRGQTDGLTWLRIVFGSLVIALVLNLYALAIIAPRDGGDESWVPWAVAAVGALAMGFISWARRRPLDGTSLQRLGATYKSNIFVRIAFAESPAVAGIAGVFIGGSLWIYLVGLAFGLLGLWFAAPSVRDIRRRQEEIAARGSALSLVEALSAFRPRRGPLGRPDTRLPRGFVVGVWMAISVGLLLVWFWVPLFDSDCPTPCDWGGFVLIGVLQLGLAVLLVAKVFWVVRAKRKRGFK